MPDLRRTQDAEMAALRDEIARLRDDLHARLPVVVIDPVLPPGQMRQRRAEQRAHQQAGVAETIPTLPVPKRRKKKGTL